MSARIIAFPKRSPAGSQLEKGPFVDEGGNIAFRVTTDQVQMECHRWYCLLQSGAMPRMKQGDIYLFHMDRTKSLSPSGRGEYFAYVNFISSGFDVGEKHSPDGARENVPSRSKRSRSAAGGESSKSADRASKASR